MKHLFAIIMVASLVAIPAMSQQVRDSQGRRVAGANPNKDKQSEEEARAKAKTGIRVWTVDEHTGLHDSAVIDTVHHAFPNTAFTDGSKGLYANLGNLGSPRQAKVFTLRPEMDYFIFAQPYDFFLKPLDGWHFTNTYQPITNITYHESGDSDNGEDQLTAKFAVNINKDAGVGFNINYIYGRGYHDCQSTAHFNFSLYGSVVKPRYKAHWLAYANYLKTRENGGIINDDYVTDPQKFPTSYTTREIPTMLDRVWNKMHYDGGQLTHRYSLGFKRVIKTADSTKADTLKADTVMAKARPAGAISASEVERDTLNLGLATAAKTDSTVFVPVTSFVHTLKLGINTKKFLANEPLGNYYTNIYMPNDSVDEDTKNLLISNYFAVELSEGLNKYLSAGIRLFGVYDYNNYSLVGLEGRDKFNEHRVTIGAQIFREQSHLLNYQLTAQTSSDGDSWGEYELRAQGRLTVPLLGDSVSLALRASSVNRKPTFFYRHFQSKYLWWDNGNLDKQLTNRIGATLQSRKLDLSLSADIYNITNYTYFATQYAAPDTPTINTSVAQSDKGINLLVLSLDKNFHWGIFNWENTLIYQTTNDKKVLPLPAFTAYSNLYIKFRIARVLNTEFGIDMRYFTKYYAP
ncbi:MAG: putative porin, partial [Bacteroidaceae bacterium]|nr:putative porin [Bacteroidaceae bacterium]